MKILELFKDEYKRKARLFPAIVSSIPGVILLMIIANHVFESSATIKFFCSLLTSLAFTACALEWFVVMIVCWIGRAFESLVFEDGKKFPSTEVLLWSNNYLSKQHKKSIRDRIANDFGIKLLSQKQEEKDIAEARKTIRDVIDRVRKAVGDGRTTLQYNIHYGAIRNLIGGCCFSLPLSLCVALVGYVKMNGGPVLYFGIALSVAYLLPLIFLSPLLKSFGRRYAKTLLAEYMAMGKST